MQRLCRGHNWHPRHRVLDTQLDMPGSQDFEGPTILSLLIRLSRDLDALRGSTWI